MGEYIIIGCKYNKEMYIYASYMQVQVYLYLI